MGSLYNKLALLFARRYFRAKKSTNAINIISYISIGGIAIGTMALIIILSVFNGFEGLVVSLYNQFNPDLVIAAKKEKSFLPDEKTINYLTGNKKIKAFSAVIQENVLLKYGNAQCIATVKGVQINYENVCGLPGAIFHGDYYLIDKKNNPFIYVGAGIEQALGINYDDPFGFIGIYLPKNGNSAVITPEDAFNIKQVKPSGSFAIQQDFDVKYAFVPIDLMRELTGYTTEINSIEISLHNTKESASVIKELQKNLGNNFKVSNRYQQNEMLYKVMQSERWVVYAILSFILMIAGFNIIGSVSMLVIEKKKDIAVLKMLGANNSFIQKVFLYEGLLLAFIGYVIGASLAFIICLLQQIFGIVKLEGGSFVIDAYPVLLNPIDFVIVFITVLIIGLFAAWLPSKRSGNADLRLN